MKRSLVVALVVIAIVSTASAAFFALKTRELEHREAQAREVAEEATQREAQARNVAEDAVQRAEHEAQQQRKVAVDTVQRAEKESDGQVLNER